MNQSTKKMPPMTAQPIAACTRPVVVCSARATTSIAATVTAYVGAITRVGSSVVRQSTSASATPTGASGSRNSNDHDQPTLAPITAADNPEASAVFHAKPGSAAICA